MLKIGILLGDDIGLEVVPEAVKVMKAAAAKTGLEVQWRELPIGKQGHELHGHTMPQPTVAALEKMDGFLCGPIGHAAYPRNDPTWIMPPLMRKGDTHICEKRCACPFFSAMRLAWAALALLLSAAAPAAEVEGVKLPERIQIGVDGPELALNGAGVRVRLIFKVYVAALYLPARMDDGEAILRDDRPSRLFLQMLRNLSAGQLTSSINDALHATLSPEQRLPLESRMQQFNAIFDALREIRKAAQIAIDYVPRLGTVVSINGEEKGRIPGADFSQALLRMWIGDQPRDPELKKALLGIGSK